MKFRIFFATDIHGSERCFRKFLNVPSFYKANVLIIGGDITGKALIPIIRHKEGYRARIAGITENIKEHEIENFKYKISSMGFYPYVVEEKEWEDMSSDQRKLEALLEELMKERLRNWISLAEEKLKNSGVRVFICPGNDDPLSIDDILNSSSLIENPDGKVIELSSDLEILGCGNANMTPWKCPRDLEEDELMKKLLYLCSKLKNSSNSIFCIHAPPYASGLDVVQRIDEEFRPVLIGDEPTAFAGSKSVRKVIEEYQPILGLHGHVHESRGYCKIGKTLCINPGSEYSEGLLKGALVEIEEGKLKKFQFTTG